jgi:hypothetical protein
MSRWIMGLCALFVLAMASPANAASYERVGSLFDNPFSGTGDGIAIHQQRAALKNSSGRLYLTDVVNDQIRVFDPTETGATEGTAFGAGEVTDPLGIAVDQETGAIYVSDDNDIVKYTGSGVLDAGFTSPGVTGPLAFDQAADELVVGDRATNQIRRYTPTGATAGPAFDGSNGAAAFAGLQDVAVTSTGDIIVVDSDGDPAQGTGTSRVERYSAAGEHEVNFGPVAGAATVAVVPGNDHVLVSGNQDGVARAEKPSLSIFDPATPGTPSETVTVDDSMNGATIRGLAAGAGPSARLYVVGDVDALYGGGYGNVTVQTYQAPAAPTLGQVRAAPTVSSVSLTANIDPELSATKYRYEYGTTTAYGKATLPQSIPAGMKPVAATSYVTGLTAQTTYHYRVIATNAIGETTGPDQTFTTASATRPKDTCPNAAIRAVQDSQGLPDCRAYEQVTPVDKNGGNVSLGTPVQGARAPGAVAFTSSTGLPGGTASMAIGWYRSKRSASGWVTDSYDLPQLNPGVTIVQATRWISPDVSKSVGASTAALTPATVPGETGVYARDLDTDTLSLLAQDPTVPQSTRLYNQFMDVARGPVFGATASLDHVIFDTEADLGHGAPTGMQHVWESTDGQLRLVDRMPDGSPSSTGANTGTTASTYARQFPRFMSDDGSSIFFTRPEGPGVPRGTIYVRRNGSETRLVSHSQRTGDDPIIPATGWFAGASSDGRYAYFQSDLRLTDDANGDGNYLYRADVENDEIILIAGEGEAQEKAVERISADGQRVYFVTAEPLVPGVPPSGAKLYLWDHGALRYLADMTGTANWAFGMTEDGRYAEFSTPNSPAGYDATSPACGGPCPQMYSYDAEADVVRCMTCVASGTSGGAGLGVLSQGLVVYAPTPVLDDGTFLFDTPDALVPEDVNRKRDVYAWKDGKAMLLSTGTDRNDAFFADLSADGTDIYFGTFGRLVAQDTDSLRDIYSVRRDGGLVSQNLPVKPPTECSADSCQGPSVAPGAPPVAGSVRFEGLATPPSTPVVSGSVKVSKVKPVTGTAVTLSVKVNTPGRVAVSGAGLSVASRTVSKAGTYRIVVRLSARGRKSLARTHRLVVQATVRFAPSAGSPRSARVALTFTTKKAKGRASKQASRENSNAKGGR